MSPRVDYNNSHEEADEQLKTHLVIGLKESCGCKGRSISEALGNVFAPPVYHGAADQEALTLYVRCTIVHWTTLILTIALVEAVHAEYWGVKPCHGLTAALACLEP